MLLCLQALPLHACGFQNCKTHGILFFFFLKSLYITVPYNSTKYKVALLESLRGAEAQRLMGEGKELHKVTGDR